MKKLLIISAALILCLSLYSQEKKVFPGADENTPSRSQYFSWINNTNEGPTEKQTLINLEFFNWLHNEFGMTLDIYAFDAGAIDGKRFYGSIYSDRFKEQFPNGLDPVYLKAKEMNTRLGVWGGPDGFGVTKEEEQARIDQMVRLCEDYEFALFKFDAVCGPLRPEKEGSFIHMMEQCRKYSPDLILLNHRLGLKEGKAHATTFLWEGWETYIDVFMNNSMTAPHHRAQAISRGLPPELVRLTEDHGVCISSCPDYWDDDLILQAFNRCMILAPEIYGNPWLLKDSEFSRLARIYNLHQKYRDIMVDGMKLPESYGPHAVARGDENTRLISLRNLEWNAKEYEINLNYEIGIQKGEYFKVIVLHPYEEYIGEYKYGENIKITVDPFRSCLIIVEAEKYDEPIIAGSKFEVIKNVEGEDIIIDLLGLPGTSSSINVKAAENYKLISLEGVNTRRLMRGQSVRVSFDGEKTEDEWHRKLSDMTIAEIPEDASSYYEATVFAADNNALEVRSLKRSGPTNIPEVKAAREELFNQKVFIDRGIWDKNLFDGDMKTGFWPSRRYNIDQRVKKGAFRLNLNEKLHIDYIKIKVNDEYALQPLLNDEGNYADVSSDLKEWKRITYLASREMTIEINDEMQYLLLKSFPDCISEIEVWSNGEKLNADNFTASNLFANAYKMKTQKAWADTVSVNEIHKGSYLSIAINGVHGVEGAYVGVKIDGKYYGCPDRATSFPSNTWEYINAKSDKNYTYYFPLEKWMENKNIEIVTMAYEEGKLDLKPEIWFSTYPEPYERKRIVLHK